MEYESKLGNLWIITNYKWMKFIKFWSRYMPRKFAAVYSISIDIVSPLTAKSFWGCWFTPPSAFTTSTPVNKDCWTKIWWHMTTRVCSLPRVRYSYFSTLVKVIGSMSSAIFSFTKNLIIQCQCVTCLILFIWINSNTIEKDPCSVEVSVLPVSDQRFNHLNRFILFRSIYWY